jgi:gamma-glutamyltranspeptidase
MPDVLRVEAEWGSPEQRAALEARGHALETIDGVGVVQVLRVTGTGIDAASDPRKGGRPAGY